VLIVGAGGLGSPASLYLAAAGVGTLGLVDFDTVDATNLQRQVLYGESDLGRPKLDAALARLGDMNPHVRLVAHPERLTSANALRIIADYDIVVDGTDNFPTRYLVNDACVLLGKRNVYGSILKFEGQLSVFAGGDDAPCYRCLFRQPPPPGLVPSCAEGGVLGVLPGHHRLAPGAGGHQAHHRRRGAHDRPAAPLRCPEAPLARAEAPSQPGVPGVRGRAVGHRAHRLRRLLRRGA
jgi:sulfur-carrier protein adenylyltransferase/sulfurtransferase